MSMLNPSKPWRNRANYGHGEAYAMEGSRLNLGWKKSHIRKWAKRNKVHPIQLQSMMMALRVEKIMKKFKIEEKDLLADIPAQPESFPTDTSTITKHPGDTITDDTNN